MFSVADYGTIMDGWEMLNIPSWRYRFHRKMLLIHLNGKIQYWRILFWKIQNWLNQHWVNLSRKNGPN